jgi:hypothetical protein
LEEIAAFIAEEQVVICTADDVVIAAQSVNNIVAGKSVNQPVEAAGDDRIAIVTAVESFCDGVGGDGSRVEIRGVEVI